MNKILLIILLLFSVLSTVDGQFRYIIVSEPDSAAVFINGEQVGNTPYVADYYWKKTAIDKKIVFSVKEEGYEPWSDTIRGKPYKLNKKVRIILNSDVPFYKFDSIAIFAAFDKIIANFDNNQRIGTHFFDDGRSEPIKWEGTVKTGDESFVRKFYEVVSKSGIPTSATAGAALFSEQERKRKQLPRFIIGAQILTYKVNVVEEKKNKAKASRVASSVRMNIEWQVFDKLSGEIVLKYSNTGISHTRTSYGSRADNLMAFENSLIDFLRNGKLNDLIKNTKESDLIIKNELNDSLKQSVTISKIKLPVFHNFSELVKLVNPSCVTIVTDGGHGSGVVIDSKGHILTANHVVEGINTVSVKFDNGIELSAKIISSNTDADVALLKIEGNSFKALPITLEDPSLGSEVFTIGTPADIELGQSISKGMISGKRLIENQTYIQLNMSVSPGNSGGPLLNDKGEIIGIVQKKIVGTGIEGIGFAISIEKALKVLGITLEKM